MLNATGTETHYPDILECLANLSSDEVFTPPDVANQMLDMLPEEVWSDPSLKWLDPGCKSGVFLREIAKKLMDGLKDTPNFEDEQVRREHIFRNMLYGLAITEVTAMTSRRTLYYTKDASQEGISVVKMPTADGNIAYLPSHHEYSGSSGGCIKCGAGREWEARNAGKENHAYAFLHSPLPWRNEKGEEMRFDVIIGNPPYHLDDGGNKASASPLYNTFIEQGISLSPKYLVMITPSRWFSGGKGLDGFRQRMLSDASLRKIVDFPDASECFPGVSIKGGVSYFLWDRDNKGTCYITTNIKGESDTAERNLSEFDILVRYNKGISILRKVLSKNVPSLSQIVSARKPFGLPTDFHGTEDKNKDSIRFYRNGGISWVSTNEIAANEQWVPLYKILVSEAYGAGEGFPHQIIGKPIIAEPNSACSETYLVIGPCKTEQEAHNLNAYLKTTFIRFLISLRKASQHVTRNVYQFAPLLPMEETWTDERLYAYFDLDNDEILFIKSMVKEME